jgi:hypothetical protein
MEAPSIAFPEAKAPRFGVIPAFALHTAIVYTCALRISGYLVGRWFAWFVPVLHISTDVLGPDWYLQHLELVTIVPALIAGYINVVRFAPAIVGRPIWDARFDSAINWAWSIPTLILLYRMSQYHAPSSVLFGSSMTAIKYFFDIQKTAPTWANPFASDPVRVVAQMFVTAPFYAGVAYSAGALLSKHEVLTKLFTFEKHEE